MPTSCLFFGMDVLDVADVDGDGHAGVGRLASVIVWASQSSAQVRRDPAAVAERGELDEAEGEIALAPGLPPVAGSSAGTACDTGRPGRRSTRPDTRSPRGCRRARAARSCRCRDWPADAATALRVLLRLLRDRLVPTVQQRLEARLRLQRLAAGPSLGRRAAPGGVRSARPARQVLVQLAAEEVADGREARHALRAALDPLALAVGLRLVGRHVSAP